MTTMFKKTEEQKKKAKSYLDYLKEAVARGQLPKHYLRGERETKEDTTPIKGDKVDDEGTTL